MKIRGNSPVYAIAMNNEIYPLQIALFMKSVTQPLFSTVLFCLLIGTFFISDGISCLIAK